MKFTAEDADGIEEIPTRTLKDAKEKRRERTETQTSLVAGPSAEVSPRLFLCVPRALCGENYYSK